MNAQKTGSPRVLVADDNDVNQVILSHQLRRLGYTVDVVADGGAAVAAVAANHYDVVLLDCSMPVLDGYEAAQVMRTNGHVLPIIAVSAGVHDDDRERCANAGMDDYLGKPYPLEALARLMERWCAPL